MSKPTHGGARKGAGRPPRSHALQAITLRVEPSVAERFRELAKSHQRSQARQFTAMLDQTAFKDGVMAASNVKEVECKSMLRSGIFWGRGWDRLYEKIDEADGSWDDLMYAKKRADTAYENAAKS